MVMIIPMNVQIALISVGFCLVFELLRIVIAFLLGRPPSAIRELQATKAEVASDIASIKSVQLEFVKHSKLTRQLIKVEKQVETLQFEHAPKFKKLKNYARICRVVAYSSYCIYFYSEPAVAVIDSNLLWPFGFFAGGEQLELPFWVFVVFLGLAWRHLLRTILIVCSRSNDFP